jgi:uncharacterized protein (DUF1501 family)
MDHHKHIRKGTKLSEGKAHQKDHAQWSRRTFLKNLGIASSAGVMLGGMSIHSLFAHPLAYAFNCSESDRILVLIRLNGGNDGLNTIIPIFDYGTYSSNRSSIAISQNNTFSITPELAVNNRMATIEKFWQDGKMKVVNNVGYEDQNLSHFRSSDIWDSASNSNEFVESGWLGRLFENEYPDYITNPPDCPPAIEIGNSGSFLFNNSEDLKMGVNFANPQTFQNIAQQGSYFDAVNVPDCYYGQQLSYVRSIANSVYLYAEAINEAYESSSNSVTYPGDLGAQLSLVARMIKGGLGTRVYMVSLGSFDTHAGQTNSHGNLLQNLADSVDKFYEDLGDGGYDKQVLSMTISEFGRRVQQNASNGTDHGAAAPVLFFGEGLNGNGSLGGLPDLQDLDSTGNLKYQVDFRNLYASVLENWLCLDAQLVDNVLGGTFDRIDDLGINCVGTSSAEIQDFKFSYKAYQDASGQFSVEYSLPKSSKVQLGIYNMLGQQVAQLHQGQQPKGKHQHQWMPLKHGGSVNYYICRLTVNGKDFSQPVILRH